MMTKAEWCALGYARPSLQKFIKTDEGFEMLEKAWENIKDDYEFDQDGLLNQCGEMEKAGDRGCKETPLFLDFLIKNPGVGPYLDIFNCRMLRVFSSDAIVMQKNRVYVSRGMDWFRANKEIAIILYREHEAIINSDDNKERQEKFQEKLKKLIEVE